MSVTLNSRQREAVRYTDGPLLVLAGAGSGKTGVITHKIAHLVRRCELQAKHIYAVTFTNKAAREMKHRAGNLLSSGNEAKGLNVSTFHTLGLNIIRREIKTLGYKAGFSIFDAQDALALIQELMRKEYQGSGGTHEQVQWQISQWKNDLLSPEQAMERFGSDPVQFGAAQVYSAYNRHLKAYNALDFDDLIYRPVRLFQSEPEVLDRWQNRVRYLLVDEYQDTNFSQYALVKMLAGVRGALTVVGDDDQSIYAWRGARPDNLLELKNDFPNLKVIKLEQNYRSMGRILKVANQLIANNPHVFTKKLWSEMGYGDPLRVIRARDDEHEAERVVSEIISHRFKHRTEFGDYAILYRSNHQSRIFERMLREQNIPYALSGGTSFFAYSEVKDIMGYLRLLVNQDDDAAFLRVVNVPRRGIGAATAEKLAAYASQRECSLFAACFELGLEQHLSDRAVANLHHFAEWLTDTADRAQRGDAIGVVRDMLRDINYETWLNDNSQDEKAAERRMGNVMELIAWMQRIQEQHTEEKTLADMVAHMSLMDILDRNNESEIGDRVSLMTFHAAKGLEFPHVFMVGMEEQILPHRSSIEEDNFDEERRLAYVGITRARKTLTFTLAAKRKRAGEWRDCEPSRFLAELPADDLEWEGGDTPVDPEKRQERGQAHLANLRGLLGAAAGE